MSWIVVDVEADGPVPGDYSMVALGAVVVDPFLDKKFYGRLRPVSSKWIPEALEICKFTREETLAFDEAQLVMKQFKEWVAANGGSHPFFASDNNGFDWQFVNWYFHHFLGENPFGFSSTNLRSLYNGLTRDVYSNFKHLRKGLQHKHHPLYDALSNAEAFLKLKSRFGLKINW